MRSVLFSIPFLLLMLTCTAAQADNADERVALNAMSQPDAVLIDVRTPEEFAEGSLPGARQIEFDQIAEQIAAVAPDKSKPVILYCRSGRRSGIAQKTLADLGYSNVIDAGGYERLLHALNAQPAPACSNC
jgi:phage shock protein E